MNIFGDILISYFCCLILSPILYFMVWELYKRKEWVEWNTRYRQDERFWKYDTVQVAEVRPQVKDVFLEFDSYWLWWMPLVNAIYTIVMSIRVIAYPINGFLKYVIQKISNIKV